MRALPRLPRWSALAKAAVGFKAVVAVYWDLSSDALTWGLMGHLVQISHRPHFSSRSDWLLPSCSCFHACLVVLPTSVFFFFSSYSATKWPVAAPFFAWPQTEPIHRCADLGEMISFLSRVIAILATSATRPSNVLRSPRQGEWKFPLFLDDYWQSDSRESFCAALGRTGPNAWC